MSAADALPPGLRSPPLVRAKDHLKLVVIVLRSLRMGRPLHPGEADAAFESARRAVELIEEAEKTQSVRESIARTGEF